jgi:hypothetical protein
MGNRCVLKLLKVAEFGFAWYLKKVRYMVLIDETLLKNVNTQSSIPNGYQNGALKINVRTLYIIWHDVIMQ